MGKAILFLLLCYFAVIGMERAIHLLQRRRCPRALPEGCHLLLLVGEDPDRTEQELHRCRCLLRESEAALSFGVLLPHQQEAQEICRRYCHDHDLPIFSLPTAEECIIINKEHL